MIFGLPSFIAELLIAAGIAFAVAIFYRILINQNELRDLKIKQKEKQEKLKELQKTNPQEANKILNEMLALTNKQLKMSMKPMIPTLILVLVVLTWLSNVLPDKVVILPFSLPFFGNGFDYLWWYIIISIPLGQLFRKMMGVEL